jgi:hypothetical protein
MDRAEIRADLALGRGRPAAYSTEPMTGGKTAKSCLLLVPGSSRWLLWLTAPHEITAKRATSNVELSAPSLRCRTASVGGLTYSEAV